MCVVACTARFGTRPRSTPTKLFVVGALRFGSITFAEVTAPDCCVEAARRDN
jgi:hypothetical protein